MSISAKIYLSVFGLAGLVVAFVVVSQMELSAFGSASLLLIIASFVAQIREREILPKWRLSTQIAVSLAAVFIGGLHLGVSVVLLSTLPAECILRWYRLKQNPFDFFSRVAFNTGQLILSTSAAALVLDISGGHAPPYVTIEDYLPLVMAFGAYTTVNNSLVAGIIHLVSIRSFSSSMRFTMKTLHVQFLTMGVLAILMAQVYSTSPGNIILAILPLALVHFSMRGYLSLRSNSHETIKNVSALLAERDMYTGQHSDEVEKLATELAVEVKLSDEEIENIKMGAAIHDIGKIAVPDAILNKEGPLNDEEWIVMKRHPVVGAQLIGNLEIYRDVIPIVLHEHEHWDGGGYPNGLSKDSIPLGARIVAVADVYNALTTERVYRPPQGKPLKYSTEQACDILLEMAGAVLDPELVDLFIQNVVSLKAA